MHHVLLLVFIPMLLLHCVNFSSTPELQLVSLKFAYYLAVPLVLYAAQRVLRAVRAAKPVVVLPSSAVSGGILELNMR